MPGKKKADSKKGKGKAKAQETEEEATVDHLQAAFKKECRALNVSSNASQPIVRIFQSYLDDEEKGVLSQLCVAVPIDGIAVQALFNSVQKSKYSKLKCICFWRCNIADNGAQAAGEMIGNLPIEKLEIRDCGVTSMGCELLAKSLLLNNRKLKSLSTLRLDFNRIGSAGLLQIAQGLENNRCVRRLSFAFCAIDGDQFANQALQHILSNCFLLEELNLEHNALRTKGCRGLITGISNIRSTTFRELNLSSNQIGHDLVEGDAQIIHGLALSFKACKSLKKISFHGNFFNEKMADVFLMMLSEATHITTFTVPHTLPPMIIQEISRTLQSHQPKATKKSKGGKAKKGKKKSKKKK